MTNLKADPPPKWAEDTLTAFFDNVRANQYATFFNKKSEFSDLVEIENLFMKLFAIWADPEPEFPAGFLLRSHAAFRAGAAAAAAGQLFETHALLRLCLEHALYAFYIAADQERYVIWLNRHDSDDHKKNVRDKFTNKKMTYALTQASSALGEAFGTLYERLIDFGAHPNERGYSLSTSVKKGTVGRMVETIYLHDDGLPFDLGLKTAAQVGICVLLIAELIYRDRFQTLGLQAALYSLKSRH